MRLRRRLTHSRFVLELRRMDVERIIDEIEQLQEIFEAPDIRPLTASDISAANRRHDEKLAHSPWFQLWQRYGVCCRTESPVLRPWETEG
jgi:hypothetical protein